MYVCVRVCVAVLMLPPLSACACAHEMTWMYMYHSCVSFVFLVVMYILFLHIIFRDIESHMQIIKKFNVQKHTAGTEKQIQTEDLEPDTFK